jgi:DNA-directed RNA polymerase subunit RPC12/RpoP
VPESDRALRQQSFSVLTKFWQDNPFSMWLRYGVDASNTLVAIENTQRGKTDLICPYCGSKLIAKKGRVKEHHFAHNDDETCRMVSKREPRDLPILPLYDSFNIFLTGKQLEQLKKLWHRHKLHSNSIHSLEIMSAFTRENLVKHNQHLKVCSGSGAYQFTDLGKIPVKALSLSRFNFVQEPLIGNVLDVWICPSYCSSKLMTIDEQSNHCVVHLLRLRKTDRLSRQSFDASSQGQMLALNSLSVGFPDGVMLFI